MTLWWYLFALNAVLLALLALSWPLSEPGSGARVIAVVSLGFVLASLVGLAVVLRIEWDPFE